MKCLKIKNTKRLEVGKISVPSSKNGNVIIKVEACGICGSDIHYWIDGSPVDLVLGHEFAGTVVDPGNSKFNIGDRVTGLPISPCGKCEACKTGNPQYCKLTWNSAVGLSETNPGGYAEFTSCRPDLVRLIPNNMSFNAAAMVEPTAVSLHAVKLADIKVGDRVLIIGGGIIGLMAAELAKLEGATSVTLLETNMNRAKKGVTIGATDEYFDATKDNTVQELLEKTSGGFDIVIECCGNSAAVSEAIMTVKPGGTIILVGVSNKPVTIPTVLTVLGEVTIKGAIAYTEKDFDNTIDLISNKKIDVEKYIDDIIPLEKGNEAFERLTSGTDDAVKIIINPTI